MSARSPFWPLVAAATTLIVVHGFGRFIYTPLIPLLVSDGLLTLQQAAQLATWNYVGDLAGAMVALFAYQSGWGRSALLTGVLGNAVITLLQVGGDYFPYMAGLRLFNGITNGIVFVLAPALVLEWLAVRNKATLSGLMYLGVGAGLLLSNQIVESTAIWLQGNDRWIPAAMISIPLALWSGIYLFRLSSGDAPVSRDDHSALWDKQSTPLFLSYFGAGLGYILPMTFLPAVAQEWSIDVTPSPWLIAAIASVPSIFIWNSLGNRLGDRNALILNYAVQAASIMAIFILPASEMGLWLCAALMGGSFLGAVFLTQRLARAMHPHQGPRLSAALIALYGVAQLLGPIVAEAGIHMGATLSSTFIWGLGACVWALLLMLRVPVQPR
ncbi:MAG: YbfB/YjiJ family MFS transporter [Pseudomonadota bacterium]|nr:YbfB/YjiJ family MFS transporter [Pseudomonadota bacterium]